MELDLASALEIISALSSIDGSVGWNAMIGSGGGIFAPLLPREIYDRLYETGPDTIVAGSSQPAGTAEKEGDQWCVTGRWPFASGCMHAAWIMALCTMKDGGKHLLDGRWYPNRPRVFLAGARLGDRRHLACRGAQGHRQSSH